MGLEYKDVERWVIEYQSKLIKERYAKYQQTKETQELLNFFFKNIYSPPELRKSHKKRTETYLSLAKSTPLRLLLIAMPKDIERGVKKIIDIYEQTSNLEDRLIDRLYFITQEKRLSSIRQINDDMYRQALKESCTYFEKRKQLENVLELIDIIQNFIERGSLIFDMAIKFLSKYGVAEIVVEGYNLLKRVKSNIPDFKKIIKEEEMKYLQSVFKK